jgi:hypothetical protein
MIAIKRQFIWDATGAPIGVILPIEEFALVETILDQQLGSSSVRQDDEAISLIEQAASDPLFIADLDEVMSAFANVDSEWWEPAE